MSPEKSHAKHASVHAEKKQGSFEIALPVRLGIAAILFLISVLFKMPPFIHTILLVLSTIVAGYDVFLAAVDEVADKQFFSTDLVIVFSAVLAFVIGFGAEGAAMVLLYQLSKILIDFTRKLSVQSAREMFSIQDEDVRSRVEEIISEDDAGSMKMQRSIDSSAKFVLRFIFVAALLYALLFPLISGLSFRISIHRALMILLVASPLSVSVSFPIVGINGLAFSARNGILFNSAEVLEEASEINVALFDKAGVFSEESPHLLGLQSDILDKKTFLHFLAHAVYYSDQPFAAAIADYYDQEYRLDLITDFSEIQGSGVSLKIGSADVVLASEDYFEKQGIEIPKTTRSSVEGISYYMTVAGRYVGRAVISSEIKLEAEELIPQMEAVGVTRNILLTEDGNEQSQSTAESLHFSEVIGECDVDKKLRLISDISSTEQNVTAYVYANGIEGHSAANLDVRVNRKGKYADALILPEAYLNIPLGIECSRRVKELISENAVFVFVVKAILLFLSFIGYSTLWFVVFIDLVAALAAILNASRVSSPSLLKKK